MRTTLVETFLARATRARALRLSRDDALRLATLAAIVALAAALRFANLAALGYANHYYAAAVKSMLQSWHNLFFVAAEPGGSVSVDKPPVGLWIQVISAYFFGVNGFGVLLPRILAGIASVVVVYHLVRRWFGTAAGLLAALALAITPVVVATDRNNTIDSTLVLTLLLAAWAFIKATETRRLKFLLLGAALVGIGFNIKMLQAYLPLPAFYALYLLGSGERLTRKLGKLTLASVLLIAVSLSWALAVDLTPPDKRPYVGSSGDNSVMSLIVGYNGMQRLLGMGGLRGGGPGGNWPGAPRDGAQLRQPGRDADGAFAPPAPWAGGALPQPGRGGNGAWPPVDRGGPGGFMAGTGRPGLLRLFTVPLSKEVSWLLPFGLCSALLLAFRGRLRQPLALQHQALVLWGGWLLVGGAFFSVAGFFHEYYLTMLAPPLAALVGTGVAEMWRLYQQHRWPALALFLAAAIGTLALQIATARAFVGAAWWLAVSIALLASGAAVFLAATASRRLSPSAVAGFAMVVAALLVTPGIWSALTMLNASENQSLPSAYSGRPTRPSAGGGLQVNQALLDYLQPRTQDTRYLMAVPSSMQGADYVLATGRPVLYMGGFMGQDQVLTTDKLARLVANGELRYIFWDGRGGGFGNRSDISQWIAAHGRLVEGFDTQTRNSGAPDGTVAQVRGDGPMAWGRGDMQVSLYELGM